MLQQLRDSGCCGCSAPAAPAPAARLLKLAQLNCPAPAARLQLGGSRLSCSSPAPAADSGATPDQLSLSGSSSRLDCSGSRRSSSE
ncbi:hypothetical protein CYMTET_51826 [Cymbomonas tetramitiformis]|uniref:Uncharacterized protein n=1 Tax=Cymbomonas tetramitiformis TaxID=36881 RepID=A0AAE0BLX5_9CHLO|nr:hypothetical protein CYMTET_51826 [Cymbomonas tetramitiformis]